MVWTCTKIRPVLSEVTEFIASNFELFNVFNPKWCLLGVFENVDLLAKTKSSLRLLLFYAGKTISLHWINVDGLQLGLWKKNYEIKKVLLLL